MMRSKYEVKIPIGDKLAYRLGEFYNLSEACKLADSEGPQAYVVEVRRQVVYRPGQTPPKPKLKTVK